MTARMKEPDYPELRAKLVELYATKLRAGCPEDTARRLLWEQTNKYVTYEEATRIADDAVGMARITPAQAPTLHVEPPTQPKPDETPSNLAEQLESSLLERIQKMDEEFGILFELDELELMENWVKARVSDRVLEAFNTSLIKLRRRKLNYQDLAVIAIIHHRSVTENDGYSMHSRFTAFSQSENAYMEPVYSGHVTRALDLLEGIGFTKMIAKFDKAKHLPSRYSVIEIEGLGG